MSATPQPLPALDASRCPLCGQANGCAIAAGLPAQDCWCMQKVISAQALEAIPPEQRGQVCVCPACGKTPPP